MYILALRRNTGSVHTNESRRCLWIARFGYVLQNQADLLRFQGRWEEGTGEGGKRRLEARSWEMEEKELLEKWPWTREGAG